MDKNKKIFLVILVSFIICFAVFIGGCDNNNHLSKAVVISFNANGGVFPGNVSAVSITLNQNDKIKLPSQEPTKDGYVFIGWYLDLNFKEADKLNIALFKAVESRTVFAKWESVETYPHTISIVSYDEGTINVINIQADDNKKIEASKGRNIIVSVSPKPGYMLKPDSLRANDIIIEEDGTNYSFTMLPCPVVITAVFELMPYNITVYEQENVAINISKESARKGEQIYIDALPTLGYYVKKIYDLSKPDENILDFFIMPANPVVLAAEVIKINYNIKYNITIDEVINAQLKTAFTQASAGEYVPIEVICDEGFICDQIMINNCICTEKEGFVMPEEDVILKPIVNPINKDKLFNLIIQVKDSTGLITDIIIPTSKKESTFYEGEIINLNLSSLNKVTINNMLLNGVFVSLDRLVMPKQDSVLTITLSPRIYTITVSDTYSPKPSVSHSYATEGELIKLQLENIGSLAPDSVEFKYINLCSELYEEYDIELDGISDFSSSFYMPNFDIEIRAMPKHITSTNEYSITINQIGDGYIESNIKTARLNEVIKLEIIPAEGFGLFSLIIKHGPNYEEDVLISYEKDKNINMYFTQTNISFLMKNSNIIIDAFFKPIVIINAHEDSYFSIYPDKAITFEGESIKINIINRGESNMYTVSQLRYNDTEIINQEFVIPENMPIINLYYDKIPNKSNAILYRININNDNNYGEVSVISTSYSPGKLVKLKISENKGFKLKSLKLHKTSSLNDDGEYISDNFIMKNYDVTIIPEFVPIVFTSFSLINRYLKCAKELYTEYGVFLSYLNNYLALTEHFEEVENIEISPLFKHMEIVIYGQTNWGNQFYIINLNKLNLLNNTAQVLDKYFKYRYSNKYIKTDIIDNYIIVSIDGIPSEDYYLFKYGLFKDNKNKCILFKQPTGTYGVYNWTSNDVYISIPKDHSEDGVNYRIVDYLGKNSFINKQDIIKGIDLANIKELAPYSLSNLQITSLDLSSVTYLNSTALLGLNKNELYIVSNENPVFSQDNGVLFDKNKQTLVSYPAGAVNSSLYEVPITVIKIDDFAFYDVPFLNEIMFKGRGKLVKIGKFSFASMINLTRIYAETDRPMDNTANFTNINSLSGLFIEDCAFDNTKNIVNYMFTSLKELGNNSLYWDGESNITINLDDNINEVKVYNHVFNGCSLTGCDYRKLNILISRDKKDYYTNHNIWKLYLSN